jgi:hypothetical protein
MPNPKETLKPVMIGQSSDGVVSVMIGMRVYDYRIDTGLYSRIGHAFKFNPWAGVNLLRTHGKLIGKGEPSK